MINLSNQRPNNDSSLGQGGEILADAKVRDYTDLYNLLYDDHPPLHMDLNLIV